MTITATVRFKSSLSLKEVFGVTRRVVDTPINAPPPDVLTEEDSVTLSNPCCIGAKALAWATYFYEDQRFHVFFDIPSCSNTDLDQVMTDLIQHLELTEWAWNYDLNDEWIGNVLPSAKTTSV